MEHTMSCQILHRASFAWKARRTAAPGYCLSRGSLSPQLLVLGRVTFPMKAYTTDREEAARFNTGELVFLPVISAAAKMQTTLGWNGKPGIGTCKVGKVDQGVKALSRLAVASFANEPLRIFVDATGEQLPNAPAVSQLRHEVQDPSGCSRIRFWRPAEPSVPTNWEEFFAPLMELTDNLPEVRRYMDLLAESTNSSAAMQKHLLRMTVRGLTLGSGAVRTAIDPLDRALGCTVERAVEMLLVPAGTPEPPDPVRFCESPLSTSEAGNATAGKHRPWRKLRLAVLGTSCFKGRSKDDSCKPEPMLHTVHRKCLSLMVTMMISGIASSLLTAVHPPVPSSMASGDSETELGPRTAGCKGKCGAVQLAEQGVNVRQICCSPKEAPSPAACRPCTLGRAASTSFKLVFADPTSWKSSMGGFVAEVMGTALETTDELLNSISSVARSECNSPRPKPTSS